MLKETVRAEFNAARKAGDAVAKSALEAVIAGILLKEKSGKGELCDQDVIDCVIKELKVQKEISALYAEKRPEMATEAEAKILVLNRFLPAQLTEAEVLGIIREADVYEDASAKTKGMIIKTIMPKLQGKFDKAAVNPLVERYLASKL